MANYKLLTNIKTFLKNVKFTGVFSILDLLISFYLTYYMWIPMLKGSGGKLETVWSSVKLGTLSILVRQILDIHCQGVSPG